MPRSGLEQRAQVLFQESQENIHRRADRLFARLMIFQWLAGIAAAVWISPGTWIGTTGQIHSHVWAAIFLGGLIAGFPVLLAWKQPGQPLTRHTIAVAQMIFSALLIHLTGGRIETHFHVFGSLAFLAFYRDWRVLITATAVVAVDHFARGVFWPQSVFGILAASHWRWLEHAGWVVFEDTFLLISIRQSLGEMFDVATRRAKLEAINVEIENRVAERTAELTVAAEELRRSEEHFSSAFEHAAIGMALVSPSGHWLRVNRSLCDSLGYPAEELAQKTFQEITHPDDLETDLQLVRQVLDGEIRTYQLEKRYFHRQGHVVWTLLSVSLVRDARDRPVHFISQIQDISRRKEAEAELEKSNKELMESSRRAGMAEVATGVLHNVGNVLNSVNIASSCVADSLRKSKAANLAKVVGMLGEHERDLGTFLTSDPRGKQLPGYLMQLAEHLTAEQAGALKELAELQKNIEHIKVIVSMQQGFAKVSGTAETLSAVDLVEDALKMNINSIARHDMTIIKEFQQVPLIKVEKHKVLQILVNLVRNAKQACDETDLPEKRLTLRVTNGSDHVRIAVSDNGIGIPPENLSRVFAHGFTTKESGHGFGLHSGALAAKELGGSLAVHSDGPGQGATFTLELPLSSIEN